MEFIDKYILWTTPAIFDAQTRAELSSHDFVRGAAEIEDRFYRCREFGTRDLCGVMGVGMNRMNKYTVGKATQGFGKYLLDSFGTDECRFCGVIVCYDARNNSRDFVKATASVLSGMGAYESVYTRMRDRLRSSDSRSNTLMH